MHDARSIYTPCFGSIGDAATSCDPLAFASNKTCLAALDFDAAQADGIIAALADFKNACSSKQSMVRSRFMRPSGTFTARDLPPGESLLRDNSGAHRQTLYG